MASAFANQYIHNTKQKINTCCNCGLQGHHYKYCTEPITSYGIIAFRISDLLHMQPNDIGNGSNTYIPSNLEYLMVQRRDSIGFIELLRAKYKLTDIPYIQEQIDGTTPAERHALLTKPFDELWTSLWGGSTFPENKQYRQEYEVAKQKFETFVQGYVYNGVYISLQTLIEATPVYYQTPEWGFPKGRRNVNEPNYKCAVREFIEETGLKVSDIHVLENIEPIVEIFCGNNNIHYKHVYYIAYIPGHIQVNLQYTNEHMMREIGDIKWVSLQSARSLIRPTNPQKKAVLEKVSTLLHTLCPLFIGPMTACYVSQTEPSTVNRNNESAAATRITNPWGKPHPGFTGSAGSTGFADFNC
jgi:8-oxo-dGTP pyrophosphatase MutT (NUDIX family)